MFSYSKRARVDVTGDWLAPAHMHAHTDRLRNKATAADSLMFCLLNPHDHYSNSRHCHPSWATLLDLIVIGLLRFPRNWFISMKGMWSFSKAWVIWKDKFCYVKVARRRKSVIISLFCLSVLTRKKLILISFMSYFNRLISFGLLQFIYFFCPCKNNYFKIKSKTSV